MFNRKFISAIIIITLAAVVAVTTTRCYDDDKDARVTIHLERNDLAAMGIQPQKHFIDRVLEFFSTRAEATIGWSSLHGDLTLKVSSSSFDEMIYSIPTSATSYTVTIPSTNGVTFQVTSYTNDGDVSTNWGGYTTKDLGPGDQDITINMIPMTIISSISSGATWIEIQWETTTLPIVTGYSIYRSTNANGPYSLISVVAGNTSNLYNDNDSTLTELVIYYYKISVNTANSTGVLCDYNSGQLSF